MTSYLMDEEYRSVVSFDSDATTLITNSSIFTPRPRRLEFQLQENQVFPVVHLADMTAEEIQATWYERDDYRSIKLRVVSMARKLSRGDWIQETDRQTARGLEYRTKKGSARRTRNKQEAIAVVLEEQQRQSVLGEDNPEFLSECYRTVSFHCQEDAQLLAMADEAWIRKDLQLLRSNQHTKSVASWRTLFQPSCNNNNNKETRPRTAATTATVTPPTARKYKDLLRSDCKVVDFPIIGGIAA